MFVHVRLKRQKQRRQQQPPLTQPPPQSLKSPQIHAHTHTNQPLLLLLILIMLNAMLPLAGAAYSYDPLLTQQSYLGQQQQQQQSQQQEQDQQDKQYRARSYFLDEQTAAMYRERFNDFVQRRQQMQQQQSNEKRAIGYAEPHRLADPAVVGAGVNSASFDIETPDFPYTLTTESWFKPQSADQPKSYYGDRLRPAAEPSMLQSSYNDDALQYEMSAEPRKMSDVYRGDYAAIESGFGNIGESDGYFSPPANQDGVPAAPPPAPAAPKRLGSNANGNRYLDEMANANNAGGNRGSGGAPSGMNNFAMEVERKFNYGGGGGSGSNFLGNGNTGLKLANGGLGRNTLRLANVPLSPDVPRALDTSPTSSNTYNPFDQPRFALPQKGKNEDHFMPYSMLNSVTARPLILGYGSTGHELSFAQQRQKAIDAAFKSAEQALGFIPKPSKKIYPFVDELVEKLSNFHGEKDVLKKSSNLGMRTGRPQAWYDAPADYPEPSPLRRYNYGHAKPSEVHDAAGRFTKEHELTAMGVPGYGNSPAALSGAPQRGSFGKAGYYMGNPNAQSDYNAAPLPFLGSSPNAAYHTYAPAIGSNLNSDLGGYGGLHNDIYAPSTSMDNYHGDRFKESDIARQTEGFNYMPPQRAQQQQQQLYQPQQQQQQYYTQPVQKEQRISFDSAPGYGNQLNSYHGQSYSDMNTNPTPDDNEDYFDLTEDMNELKRLASIDFSKPETLQTNYNPYMRYHRKQGADGEQDHELFLRESQLEQLERAAPQQWLPPQQPYNYNGLRGGRGRSENGVQLNEQGRMRQDDADDVGCDSDTADKKR